jgi:hypothetical protein
MPGPVTPYSSACLDGYAAMLAGPPPTLTPTVQAITGRPARSLRQWVADHAADFT